MYCEFSDYHLSLPCTTDEAKELFHHDTLSPFDSRLLKIAIIGVPNSGKSTLINKLTGRKVSS